jgi:hypothetical protein
MNLKYFLKFSFISENDIPVFRHSGVPAFRHSGVQALRCSGIPVFRHSFFYYMPIKLASDWPQQNIWFIVNMNKNTQALHEALVSLWRKLGEKTLLKLKEQQYEAVS